MNYSNMHHVAVPISEPNPHCPDQARQITLFGAVIRLVRCDGEPSDARRGLQTVGTTQLYIQTHVDNQWRVVSARFSETQVADLLALCDTRLQVNWVLGMLEGEARNNEQH